MARVMIESDEGWPVVRIEVQQEPEMGAAGWCAEHQEWITDRGHFEDTCEAIGRHIDTRHAERN